MNYNKKPLQALPKRFKTFLKSELIERYFQVMGITESPLFSFERNSIDVYEKEGYSPVLSLIIN